MSATFGTAGAAFLFLVLERVRPARRWPRVPGFLARALALSAFQLAAVAAAVPLWRRLVGHWHLLPGDRLGVLPGALCGFLVLSFFQYWWHRWRHELPLLWRWLHQLHHSPRRIELVTAFYRHPLEALANAFFISATLTALLGLTPVAAAGAAAISGGAELLYHANVATPRWLGYFIQRPESHCLHHETNVHSFNYSDLPLWDILFGTFRNPPAFDGRCGFSPRREASLVPMLLGRDVSAS